MCDSRLKPRILEIFGFFSRLGLTGFGGPAAHIALMEREAVERRRWLAESSSSTLSVPATCSPVPAQLRWQWRLAFSATRWLGLIIAGCCFVLPASLATFALAWAYVRYGHMPQAVGILYGAKPVMIAIIVQAIWRLGRMALKGWALLSLGVACFAASLAGIAPILILLLGGGLVLANQLMRSRRHATVSMWLLPFPASGSAAAATGTVGLLSIALAFLKLGVVVFGSGYVLLAFLRAELVDRLHWITNQQLLDAITAGQVTPGPVFATATFLGYLLRGGVGAVVATVGIFLPSFFMAGAVGALAEPIRKSKWAQRFSTE